MGLNSPTFYFIKKLKYFFEDTLERGFMRFQKGATSTTPFFFFSSIEGRSELCEAQPAVMGYQHHPFVFFLIDGLSELCEAQPAAMGQPCGNSTIKPTFCRPTNVLWPYLTDWASRTQPGWTITVVQDDRGTRLKENQRGLNA